MYVTFDRKSPVPVTKAAAPPEVPFWCPLCECAMGSQRDVDSYRDVSVCADCEREFSDSNRTAWLEGWRPTKEEVNQSLKKRSQAIMDRYLAKRSSDGR